MLIPSIDLQGGRVVQLVQGEQLAWSSNDLDSWVEKFAHFPMVQVIDLDAAKDAGHNRDLIEYICQRLPCQVGGGIRSVDGAREVLSAGARRVIVGSALFTKSSVDVESARQFSEAIGHEQLVAAVDGRGGKVAVRGWQATIDLSVEGAMAALEPWVGAFLATLIDGEGLMRGIDMDAATALRRATSLPLIVAGGIRSIDEIDRLDAMGMDAVVGMAIYTGRIEVPGNGAAGLRDGAPGLKDGAPGLQPGGIRGAKAPRLQTPAAVIFDFDGVIADSESQHMRAFQQVFTERGWTLSEADYFERYLGYSDREVFEVVARERGEVLPSMELNALMASKSQAYADLLKAGAVLCPGADQLIRRLVTDLPLAIASSALSHEIVEVIEGAGLSSCFTAIVGADDVAHSKPAPDGYLEAARRLGIAPEQCVAIEDSPWGLESARSAGMRTIAITHTYPAARLTMADVVVESLDEISEAFVRDLLVR